MSTRLLIQAKSVVAAAEVAALSAASSVPDGTPSAVTDQQRIENEG